MCQALSWDSSSCLNPHPLLLQFFSAAGLSFTLPHKPSNSAHPLFSEGSRYTEENEAIRNSLSLSFLRLALTSHLWLHSSSVFLQAQRRGRLEIRRDVSSPAASISSVRHSLPDIRTLPHHWLFSLSLYPWCFSTMLSIPFGPVLSSSSPQL